MPASSNSSNARAIWQVGGGRAEVQIGCEPQAQRGSARREQRQSVVHEAGPIRSVGTDPSRPAPKPESLAERLHHTARPVVVRPTSSRASLHGYSITAWSAGGVQRPRCRRGDFGRESPRIRRPTATLLAASLLVLSGCDRSPEPRPIRATRTGTGFIDASDKAGRTP